MWRGEGWIEDWNEGIIVPVVKKGESVRVEEYRGITLTLTLYKVYASVLANRLKEDMEGRKVNTTESNGV